MTTAVYSCGALACQRDRSSSYTRNLTTIVKSCEPSTIKVDVKGKKEKIEGFEVILNDTILFPEGGGQPDDRGTINNVEVLRITRRGGDAVHFVTEPFDLGAEVKVTLDWKRRWDHMQQHSGQHLITALADNRFGYPTTSWNLGEKTSFIELDTPSMSEEQRIELEDVVNENIRECRAMYPTIYEGVDDPELKKVRTRGLPDDHVGPVRVVTIEGLENNMCCGTHVSNLAHLQAIKLLSVEKGKKGKVNLNFVAGQRVLSYLGNCYESERAFVSLLKGSAEQHVELLTKLQNSFRIAQRNSTSLLREVAQMEAQKFKALQEKPPYLILHRKEGDNEYMNIIVNELKDENVLIFISTGDDRGAGLFMLSGPEDLVSQISPKISEIIEGKGAGKNGRFQGKANKLSKKHLAEKLIKEQFGLS